MKLANSHQSCVSEEKRNVALDLWRQSADLKAAQVVGRSMFPIVRHGDQVFVQPGTDGLGRGDLVVFFRDKELMVHRLLKWHDGIDGRRYILKGDNRLLADPVLTAEALLGSVVAVERNGRRMTLDTPVWRVLNVIIVVLMLPWTWAFDHLNRSGKGGRLPRLLSRSVRSALAVFLRIVALLFSRWR